MPSDKQITFREAEIADIGQLHAIRLAVSENVLVNHSLVTVADYENYLTSSGKGWVAEIDKSILGFSIVDLAQNRVWALFVHPSWEDKGIGKKLQSLLLHWYFQNHSGTLWLHTAPGTRAENFYRKTGWIEKGIENGETRFELTAEDWSRLTTPDS